MDQELKHLFQQEFSKIVAVISKRYGLEHIEIAEDIAAGTFLQAAETWGVKGMPPNPAAWLYAVAKQKTAYHFRRNGIFEKKVLPALKASQPGEADAPSFSLQDIKDSQLAMLFAICHPAIAAEAQIGLALRILCGFGIDEIAAAFLTNKETINKRLFRAKERLRTAGIELELPPPPEIDRRLDNVLHIIYLLFNEGYYSRTQDMILQKELCLEAMRLAVLLTEYEPTCRPKTNALLALMCFHASRFEARTTAAAGLIRYEQQDEQRWDKALMQQGRHFLDRSAQGEELSSYHLEARIAGWHCIKQDSPEKWTEILRLYDLLLLINYSPGVSLNRLYALYKARGQAIALAEAESSDLPKDHFYYTLLGELVRHSDKQKARTWFEKALALAKTQAEKQEIRQKLDALNA